ncbi:hypothetical protein B5F55_15485 [Anaerotruncus colihominis]|uniref:LysR family transcriptional regulator n=1 Tax=Anaerotruncus colihominis TaxID=169435 RepID=A0A3E3IMW9_9FIRM|nr:hypothetical protein B5F55_15485 [Anaerotruncus colihominis]RGE68427.1 LysR family transcriptional regulator [Anaerotruncus colihominis]
MAAAAQTAVIAALRLFLPDEFKQAAGLHHLLIACMVGIVEQIVVKVGYVAVCKLHFKNRSCFVPVRHGDAEGGKLGSNGKVISGTPLHKSLPDSGSFTSAAEKMFITSAAVMKQMNVLEDSLSFKLLERTNHSAVLPSASSLYQDARKNHSASRCGCGARSKNR